jgi:hypothetical protein
MLPRVPWLRALPSWEELRWCHVSHGLKLCFLKRGAPVLLHVPRLRALPSWEESSGAATYPTARGSAFLRWELRCYHVLHDPQWAVDHRNKEMLSCPRHADRLACFQDTLVRYRSACKTCKPLQCGSIVQYRPNWPLMNMAIEVIRPDRTAPRYEACSVQQNDKTGRLHATDVV